MFKRSIPLFISFLIVFCSIPFVWAEEEADKKVPEPIQDCAESIPDFTKPEVQEKINNNDVKALVKEIYPLSGDLNIRIAFEVARTQYHTYVECIFEKVVEGMLSSSGADTTGLYTVNAPNFPEWMKPEKACIQEETLSQMMRNGSPASILQPILTTYDSYVEYIDFLYQAVKDSVLTSEPEDFTNAYSTSQGLKRIFDQEVQDSLVALDTAFISLKDMRKAFVMHVHFQCMLMNLEFYRHAMENLRRIMSYVPATLMNASMHK